MTALRLARIATRAAEASLFGTLFLLPLTFWPLSFQTFVAPKLLVLRGLTVLALVSWGLASLLRGRLRLYRNPLFLPLSAYLAVSLLATLFSVAPRNSWFGQSYRGDGLVTLATYATLYFLAVQLLRTRLHLRRAIAWTLAGAVPVAIMGILQSYNWDPSFSNSPWLGTRASSTLGNPDFLGAYLALAWPLPVVWLLSGGPRWQRFLAAVVLALLTSALALSHTRGAWIGSAAGALVLLFFLRSRLKALTPWVALAVLLGTLLVAPVDLGWRSPLQGLVPSSGPPPAPHQDQTLAKALASLAAPTTDRSALARLLLWQAALPLIEDSPLLGSGPNSYVAVATRYVSPAWVTLAGNEGLFPDKPHNQLLEVAVSSGLPGLAAYLWLLVALARLAWSWLRRRLHHPAYPLMAALTSAWVGYLVQDIFLFDVLDAGALFWLFTALISTGGRVPARPRRINLALPGSMRSVAAGSLLLVGALALVLAWRPFGADLYLRDALLASKDAHHLSTAMPLFEKSLEMDGGDELVLLQFAAARTMEARFNPQKRLESSRQAISLLNEAIGLNPRLALLYLHRGRAWDLQPGQEQAALSDYRRAAELYPHYPEANMALGDLLHRLGRPQEAVLAGVRLLQVRPKEPDVYFNLGIDYAALRNWGQAIAVWQEGERLAPTDAGFPFRLGTAFEAQGDLQRAREAYRQALALDPAHADTQKALARLGPR